MMFSEFPADRKVGVLPVFAPLLGRRGPRAYVKVSHVTYMKDEFHRWVVEAIQPRFETILIEVV